MCIVDGRDVALGVDGQAARELYDSGVAYGGHAVEDELRCALHLVDAEVVFAGCQREDGEEYIYK